MAKHTEKYFLGVCSLALVLGTQSVALDSGGSNFGRLHSSQDYTTDSHSADAADRSDLDDNLPDPIQRPTTPAPEAYEEFKNERVSNSIMLPDMYS